MAFQRYLERFVPESLKLWPAVCQFCPRNLYLLKSTSRYSYLALWFKQDSQFFSLQCTQDDFMC